MSGIQASCLVYKALKNLAPSCLSDGCQLVATTGRHQLRSSDNISSVLLLWTPYRLGQAVIFLPCDFFFYLSFFPGLFSAVADWMSTILPHMCGLSANLGCRSETCCKRLAESTGRKKSSKIRHLGTIAQLCPAISFQLRHASTIGKKFVKQQYLPHMSARTIW